MVTIAKQILQQHQGPFDPTAFKDRYREAVLELVEQKKQAGGLTMGTPKSVLAEAQITDLMEALKRSLAGGTPNRAAGKAKRKAAEKAPPRKAPKSSRRAPGRNAGAAP